MEDKKINLKFLEDNRNANSIVDLIFNDIIFCDKNQEYKIGLAFLALGFFGIKLEESVIKNLNKTVSYIEPINIDFTVPEKIFLEDIEDENFRGENSVTIENPEIIAKIAKIIIISVFEDISPNEIDEKYENYVKSFLKFRYKVRNGEVFTIKEFEEYSKFLESIKEKSKEKELYEKSFKEI